MSFNNKGFISRHTLVRVNPLPLHTFSDLFFNCNSSNKMEFWDFPSKTRWHLLAKVNDHTKSTIVPSTPSQFMSLDAIREKSSKACADQWITTFNRGHNKGYQFLQLRIHEKSVSIEGGGWLKHIKSLSFALC